MEINGIVKPVLINQFAVLNEPLLLQCSIFIQNQILNNGKEEISIVENNRIIFKKNHNKEIDKDISFSILNKNDQLKNFIKIAEVLHHK